MTIIDGNGPGRYGAGMPKRKPAKPIKESPHKLRPDVAETAFRVMQEATGEKPKTVPGREKNPEAAARGRTGGRRGGPARVGKLTPEERRAAAQLAADARWSRPPKES